MMAKERWTIEIEVDVMEPVGSGRSLDCVNDNPHFTVDNSHDEYLLTGLPDGIHRHAYCTCYNVFPWKLVKREPIS